ncbi:hypothetical protein [Armatimonas rosea]|uniref:Uncharacterized protein n=1 Tax=Armatimonas rosea TaxID=685828 RepID=A0A7W9SQB4_ARMRO|nr:hypothetical protein [Armatimonas rosea]MBB6050500.1 hypothetical protein [Armatimonas rosea]
MHYPEFDVLCHEVAGKLAELRRLTMETPVLTDEQEALLAELTRLLRLLDAVSSQQIHSLLGDTATPDSAFLTELYEELPLLAKPAERVSHLPRPRPSATPSSPVAPSSREEGQPSEEMPAFLPSEERAPGGREVGELGEPGEMAPTELPVPPGLLNEIYWDIRPVYPNDTRLLYAHDADWRFCLIVTDENGQTALLFDTDEARAAYLDSLVKEA